MVSTAFEGGNGHISCCFLEKTPISTPDNEDKAENFRCEVTSLCEGTRGLARRLRPEPWRPSAPSPPRASLKLNMKIFNPPNHDGVNCQFAAILDQLQLLRCPPSELNAVGLKRLAFTWLAEHGDDIIGAQWDDPSMRHGELAVLRSFIPDFDEFIANEEREWGNHTTLVAVCVVRKESYDLLVHIQVHARPVLRGSTRGDSHRTCTPHAGVQLTWHRRGVWSSAVVCFRAQLCSKAGVAGPNTLLFTTAAELWSLVLAVNTSTAAPLPASRTYSIDRIFSIPAFTALQSCDYCTVYKYDH